MVDKPTQGEMLARIDERTINMEVSLDELKGDFKAFVKLVDDKYVTKEQFKPIRLLVYGATGIILVAVLTAVVAGVIISI